MNLTVGTQSFGEKDPKICVPICMPDAAGVHAAVLAAKQEGASFVELRLDYVEANAVPEDHVRAFREAAKAAGSMPVLVTYRTVAQGGVGACDMYYADILQAAINERCAMLDVEWDHPERRKIIEAAKSQGIPCVLSAHFLEEVPLTDRIRKVFVSMTEDGADMAKIAVMTRQEAEVEAFIGAVNEAKTILRIPHVAIAMGDAGVKTRLHPKLTGSCFTFATVGGMASAPGQTDIRTVRAALADYG